MANKFYNESTFQIAIDMLETDPYHAIEQFENYIKVYPKDYYARAYYALALTRVCRIEEAEREYEDILYSAQSDVYYNTKYKMIDGFKYNMLIVKMKILAWYGRFEELYDLAINNYNVFQPNEIGYIIYYCKIKLNLLHDELIPTESYRFMQAYNYSEELFSEHLKKHLYNSSDDKAKSDYVFDENFPIDKIIEEIKKNIPSDKRTFPGYFDDTYFFRYDNCGTVNGESANVFTVVCYHNSSDIITMCPVIGYDKIPAIDLNYVKYISEEQKTKRISQIDKFNKRYNLGGK